MSAEEPEMPGPDDDGTCATCGDDRYQIELDVDWCAICLLSREAAETKRWQGIAKTVTRNFGTRIPCFTCKQPVYWNPSLARSALFNPNGEIHRCKTEADPGA